MNVTIETTPTKIFEIPVVGMTCSSCVLKVQNNISKLPGVKKASVNLVTEKATVEVTSNVNIRDIVKSIKSSGYDIAIQKISFIVQGLSESPRNIEKSLSELEGITKVSVNPITENVNIEFIPTIVSPSEIRKKLEKMGYKVPEIPEDDVEIYEEIVKKKELDDLKKRFWFSLVFTSLIISEMFLHMFVHIENRAIVNYTLFILSTLVMFYGGGKFFRSFILGIRHLSTDMNTLIAISTGSAYVYSSIVTFFPQVFPNLTRETQTYYETAAVIITLVLLGRVLEARSKAHTTSALKKLSSLQPKTATLIKNGEEISVSVKDVNVDDIILVKPGERIPLDGVVIEGCSLVDESVITGESMPVDKKEGDQVIGSTLNISGSFKFKVTRVGKDTVLSKIIQLVREAQSEKPPIQKLVDKIASVFVPIVISIGVITFFVWYFSGYGFTVALMNFITVLIIACPCALGIATPTAIATAVGKSAESGLLIKNPICLETSIKLNFVVFDKTGTITYGKPEVKKIEILEDFKNNFSSQDILKLASSVERNSEHPLGQAILLKAKQEGLELYEVEDFFYIPGQGVIGKVNSHEVTVGNMKLMESLHIDLDTLSKFLEKNETRDLFSNSTVFVSVDGRVVGMIYLSDTVKPNAREVIYSLKKMGFGVALLTGDNYSTASHIGNTLEIDKVFAELLPDEKVSKLEELKNMGYKVMMVGDGVNDAPALAKADIGIAMGSGTDVASATADVILMNDDLKGIIRFINISSKSYRIIKQNLFWAFFYNVILIPVASGVLYPIGIFLTPVLAALAMSLSSVFVVLNSLRIKKTEI